MTVQDVLQWIDAFAPFATQEEYDNSGLLLGDAEQPVSKVLFALDATPGVAAQAVRIGADLIITHHPLMFLPVHKLQYSTGEGPIIRTLMQSGIAMIAAHTNLDRCPGGVADSLAEALGLVNGKPCEQTPYLRTGSLAAPCTAGEFTAFLNRRLNACTRLYGDPDALIRSAAVGPGANGENYIHVDADAFVTGEIRHHELLGAISRGLAVFDAGHYPTEFPGIAALYRRFLADVAKPQAVEAALYAQPPYPCATHG